MSKVLRFFSLTIFYYAIILLLSSCSNGKQETIEFESKYHYLVIPVHGCPGCIQKAKSHAEEHLYSERIKYIFTDFTTEKDVRLSIGSQLFKSDRIILDRSNQLIDDGFTSSYPTLVFTEKGKLKKIILSPDVIDDKLKKLNIIITR